MAAKGDILLKLKAIIDRLKQVRAGSFTIDWDTDALSNEIEDIERDLAYLIDDFMAKKIQRYNIENNKFRKPR